MDVQYSLPNLMTTAPATGGALGDAAAWDPLLLPLVLPVRVERAPVHQIPARERMYALEVHMLCEPIPHSKIRQIASNEF